MIIVIGTIVTPAFVGALDVVYAQLVDPAAIGDHDGFFADYASTAADSAWVLSPTAPRVYGYCGVALDAPCSLTAAVLSAHAEVAPTAHARAKFDQLPDAVRAVLPAFGCYALPWTPADVEVKQLRERLGRAQVIARTALTLAANVGCAGADVAKIHARIDSLAVELEQLT